MQMSVYFVPMPPFYLVRIYAVSTKRYSLGFLVLIIALYLQNPIHEMKASIFPKRAEMLDRRRRSLNSGGQQIPYPTGSLKGSDL